MSKATTFDADGWDCPAIEDSGLLDILGSCAQADYAIRHCTRASATFGDAFADLVAYVRELAEKLDEAADELDRLDTEG